MKAELYATLRAISAVQAERRKNFAGGTEPKDAAAEKLHQKRLQTLRAKIPSQTPPAP